MKCFGILIFVVLIQLKTSVGFTFRYNKSNKKPLLAPKCLKERPINGVSSLLITGGPTNPYPRCFAALQLPYPGIGTDYTLSIRSDISHGLKYILQTENEFTFAYHGTGTTAIVAALDNLIEVGDKVVVGVTGFWSKRIAGFAERLGAEVIRRETPVGSPITVKEIEEELSKHKPKILYIVHGESSIGLLQPLAGIGDVCEKYGTLLVVDIIATVGQRRMDVDKLKIDVAMMNTQKGIGGVVGLAPITFSPKAVAAIRNRRTLPRNFQTDLIEQARDWLIAGLKNEPDTYNHSASLPLLHMLREALAKIVDEGIENAWARHAKSSRYMYERAAQMGLKFAVPVEANRLPGTMCVEYPPGKDALKVKKLMWDRYRIEISTGFGPGFRVGIFGENARDHVAEFVMNALGKVLKSPETNTV